ncbi:serine threonine protein kinase [Stylonychia lemnae]|uniref:Serine threonine protein kinase n=1 Tax=Stylonychia lemnae TaxID=5949 RepID=A0A078B4L1_STYLE|nr:serine threonine protein kinase [Stylonychia lemnae]|eukprot:CDW88162.1 serine threonine protein kinase [Stylonychia lemnae]
MNYCEKGDLFDYVRKHEKLSESQIKKLMIQLIGVVHMIHRLNVIHRDLKPDNILIKNTKGLNISLIDFGLACYNDDYQWKQKRCGTPGFMAPEIIRQHVFDLNSDIFSLGCIFYFLNVKKYLFQGVSVKQSPEGIDLMKKMLSKDPRNRLSAEKCFQHQWFQTDAEYCQKIIENNVIFAEMKNNGAYEGEEELKNESDDSGSINQSAQLPDFKGVLEVKDFNQILDCNQKMSNRNIAANHRVFIQRN